MPGVQLELADFHPMKIVFRRTFKATLYCKNNLNYGSSTTPGRQQEPEFPVKFLCTQKTKSGINQNYHADMVVIVFIFTNNI